MTKDEKAELIGQIIDIFEDELGERTTKKIDGYNIDNLHFIRKAEVPLYEEDEESDGVFYGGDYYDKVATKIEETLTYWYKYSQRKQEAFYKIRKRFRKELQIKHDDDLFYGYKVLTQTLMREPTKKELLEQKNQYYQSFYWKTHRTLEKCKTVDDIELLVKSVDESCGEHWTEMFNKLKQDLIGDC